MVIEIVNMRMYGRKNLLIYLASIVICSIGFGLLFDFIFPGLSIEDSGYEVNHTLGSSLELILSLSLIVVLFNAFI